LAVPSPVSPYLAPPCLGPCCPALSGPGLPRNVSLFTCLALSLPRPAPVSPCPCLARQVGIARSRPLSPYCLALPVPPPVDLPVSPLVSRCLGMSRAASWHCLPRPVSPPVSPCPSPCLAPGNGKGHSAVSPPSPFSPPCFTRSRPRAGAVWACQALSLAGLRTLSRPTPPPLPRTVAPCPAQTRPSLAPFSPLSRETHNCTHIRKSQTRIWRPKQHQQIGGRSNTNKLNTCATHIFF
jgi:hypothetical protein